MSSFDDIDGAIACCEISPARKISMYKHQDRIKQVPKLSENVSNSCAPGSPPDGETASDDSAEDELRAGPAGERRTAGTGAAHGEVSS